MGNQSNMHQYNKKNTLTDKKTRQLQEVQGKLFYPAINFNKTVMSALNEL